MFAKLGEVTQREAQDVSSRHYDLMSQISSMCQDLTLDQKQKVVDMVRDTTNDMKKAG